MLLQSNKRRSAIAVQLPGRMRSEDAALVRRCAGDALR